MCQDSDASGLLNSRYSVLELQLGKGYELSGGDSHQMRPGTGGPFDAI
jgi:hypothetical protein